MTKPTIETPRGAVIILGHGVNARARLLWSPDMKLRFQGKFRAAQRFVDSEVLRLCEPFIPLRTSMLIKSGILGTEIGEGVVKWIAPYARYQYYAKRKPGSQTGPLRGPLWFERMKAIYKGQILAGARAILAQQKAERAAAKAASAAGMAPAPKPRKKTVKPRSIPGVVKGGGLYRPTLRDKATGRFIKRQP
jgi:hypothetical protein